MEYLYMAASLLPLFLVLAIGGLWACFRPKVKRNFQPFQRTPTRGFRGR
jgi:hypothetical protein